MKEIYLSDVIRYEKYIETYPFIQIYSGVGSGKPMNVCQRCGHRFKPGL